jgi:hypothetical protein
MFTPWDSKQGFAVLKCFSYLNLKSLAANIEIYM